MATGSWLAEIDKAKEIDDENKQLRNKKKNKAKQNDEENKQMNSNSLMGYFDYFWVTSQYALPTLSLG